MAKLIDLLGDVDCPLCGSDERKILIQHDRYFLPIELSMCKNCGLVYTRKNFTENNIHIFYKEFYRNLYNDVKCVTEDFIFKSKDKLFASLRFNKVLTFLKSQNKKCDGIFEVGSGTGQFLQLLDNYGCENYYGIEPGNTFFEYILAQQGPSHIGNTFFEETSLSFQPNCIVAFHVLEHLHNPVDFLKKSRELLDPKQGYIIVEVPGYDAHFQWEKYGIFDFHIGHRMYFTLDTLTKMLNVAGFEIIKSDADRTEGIIINNLRVYAKCSVQTANDISISTDYFEKTYNNFKTKLSKFNLIFSFSSYLASFILNYKAIWRVHK